MPLAQGTKYKALLLTTSLVLGACSPTTQRDTDSAFEQFQETLRQIAGANPRDCGTLSDSAADEDLYAAARCVNSAWNAKEAFLLRRQLQGIDSMIWLAYASNGTVVSEVNFDSDIKGGGGRKIVPRIEQQVCQEFRIQGTQRELFLCKTQGK